jgi:pimeloyl-ACP methyl ester carboxylesterase
MHDSAVERPVELLPDGRTLPGLLTLPPSPLGVVAFAHGSGSSRLSPRNRLVASALHEGGIATLLFDLLTEPESLDRRNVFDVPLLAGRLAAATRWLEQEAETKGLPIGYFGASTGPAAAPGPAPPRPQVVRAVVSRGGRPDLAAQRLGAVRAPTLLVVGGADELVLDLNRRALEQLACVAELRVVPGAGHLFEEPGALEEVAAWARDWFVRRLPPGGAGG